MTQLFSNNASATLAGTISPTDTSLTIEAGKADLFPIVQDVDDWCKATIEDNEGNIEVVKVTSRAPGSPLMTIVRGQEGTTARGFTAGNAVVELRLTAADIEGTIAHPSQTIGAHPATAISVSPVAGMTGVGDVQAAIESLKASQGGASGAYLPISGGQMTGPIILHTESPTGTREAVPKKYVDDKFAAAGGLNPDTFVRTDTTSPQAIVSELSGRKFIANEGVLQAYGYSGTSTRGRILMQSSDATRYIDHNTGVLNFVGFTQVLQDGNPFGTGGQFTDWTNKIVDNQSLASYDLQGYSVGAYKVHAQVTVGAAQGWSGADKTVDLYIMALTPAESIGLSVSVPSGRSTDPSVNTLVTGTLPQKFVNPSVYFVDSLTGITFTWSTGVEIGASGVYTYTTQSAAATIKNIWKIW